jgi:SAM-dependent methyltransferase
MSLRGADFRMWNDAPMSEHRRFWSGESRVEGWLELIGDDPMFERCNLPGLADLLPHPGRCTVEVGCGEGRVSRFLRSSGHNVVACDGSLGLARHASGAGTSVAVADCSALPFPDAAADFVVCFMVLMDLEALGEAVSELARLVEVGGRIFIAVSHPIMTSGLFLPGDPNQTFAMGEYLRPMSHVLTNERFNGQKFEFRMEHRAIEHYSRALEDAGCTIRAIREPAMQPLELEDPAADDLSRFSRVPPFLHVLAERIT